MVSLLAKTRNTNTPAYNSVVYKVTSDLYGTPNISGLRYYVRVKESSSGTILFEKTVMPNPVDGSAMIYLDRELANYVTFDFHPDKTNSVAYPAEESYQTFYVEVGEEYYYEWRFDGATHDPDNNNDERGNLYVEWTGDPVPINFSPGDQIYVEFDDPGINDMGFAGSHVVYDTFSTASGGGVFIDMLYEGNTIISPGIIRYATNQRVRESPSLDYTTQNAVFNGAMDHIEFNNYSMTDYETVSNKIVSLLSVLPKVYKVRPDNHVFVNYMQNRKVAPNIVESILIINDQSVGQLIDVTGGGSGWIKQINIGPSRDWPPIVVHDGTKWYDILFYNVSEKPIIGPYRLVLDRSCTSGKPITMMWLDKLGSFLPYNFTLKNVQRQNVDRNTYRKNPLTQLSTNFIYNLEGGGEVIYNSGYERVYTLKTGLLTLSEAEFFQNVFRSPVTFVDIDGEFERCVIITNSIKVFENPDGGVKRYELDIRLSHRGTLNI